MQQSVVIGAVQDPPAPAPAGRCRRRHQFFGANPRGSSIRSPELGTAGTAAVASPRGQVASRLISGQGLIWPIEARGGRTSIALSQKERRARRSRLTDLSSEFAPPLNRARR